MKNHKFSYEGLGRRVLSSVLALILTITSFPIHIFIGNNVAYAAPVPIVSESPIFDISLNHDSFHLDLGGEIQLIPTLEIANHNAQDLTWSSSDEQVVTVDQNGLLTPHHPGEAVITVRSVFDGVYEEIEIYVPQPPVQSISITIPSEVVVNHPHQLIAEALPVFAYGRDLAFYSSVPEVATISNTGEIVANTAGETIITVRSENGVENSFILNTRYPLPAEIIIHDQPDNLELIVGQTHFVSAEVLPWNAVPRGITWESSNGNVAVISSVGQITAIDAGQTSIIARVGDIVMQEFVLTVRWPFPETIVINHRPLSDTLTIGQSHTLGSIITPQEAQPRVPRWSSSNTNIAEINPLTGQITPRNAGTVTISVIVEGHPHVTDYFTLTVLRPATTDISIQNRPANNTLSAGGASHQLRANIYPAQGFPDTVTWSSSNPSAASINATTGLVVPHAQGVTVITARVNQNIVATITLDIVRPVPQSVNVWNRPGGWDLQIGMWHQLSASVYPPNASQSITWSSSNHDWVYINQSGRLYGWRIRPGRTWESSTITATASNGVSTSFNVYVNVRTGWVDILPIPGNTLAVVDRPARTNEGGIALRQLPRGAQVTLLQSYNTRFWRLNQNEWVYRNYISFFQPASFEFEIPELFYLDPNDDDFYLNVPSWFDIDYDDIQVSNLSSAFLSQVENADLVYIDVSDTRVTLPMWTNYQLHAVVRPSINAYNMITFSSTAVQTASVDVNGVVTGNVQGNAFVIATIGSRSAIAMATVGIGTTNTSTLALREPIPIPELIISRRDPVLLNGTIISNHEITSVFARIERVGGTGPIRFERMNTPPTMEFDLLGTNVCRHLGFHLLDAGHYVFILEATDSTGSRELQRTHFEVRSYDTINWNNQPTIPATIIFGDEINITGYLTSDTNITSVRSYFTNRDTNNTSQVVDYRNTPTTNLPLTNTPIDINSRFSDLIPGRYTFTVRATNAYQDDLIVGYHHVIVRPQAPTGITISSTTHHGTTLSWQPVTGATGYRVYHANGRLAWIVPVHQTSITISSLLQNQSFQFYVVATSLAGDSLPSETVLIWKQAYQ